MEHEHLTEDQIQNLVSAVNESEYWQANEPIENIAKLSIDLSGIDSCYGCSGVYEWLDSIQQIMYIELEARKRVPHNVQDKVIEYLVWTGSHIPDQYQDVIKELREAGWSKLFQK